MPPRRPRRNNKRNTRRPTKRPTSRFKKGAYAPYKKKRFIAQSNPVAENKKVEGTDISADVGLNTSGNPILVDFSKNPRYQGNEPPLNGGTDLAVANLPTGARGFPLRDSVFNFNPDSAIYQTAGTDNNSMIGSSVYQRMTAAKFLIRWPQPSMNTGKWNGRTTGMPEDTDPLEDKVAWLQDPLNNHMGIMPVSPQTYHLYWGFIRTPTGYSDFTNPKKGEATAVNIEQHINLRVEEWFNQRTDRVSFIPKTNNTMKIIGKKKLRPPWDARNSRMPVTHVQITDIDGDDVNSSVVHGVIPDTLVKITWPHNRKIHFEETSNFSGDQDGTQPNVYYRNYDWLPFACIVNYNADTLPKNAAGHTPGDAFTVAEVQRDQRVPHVLVNDITYYRDS